MQDFIYNLLIQWGWPEQNARRQVEIYFEGVRDHRLADDTLSAIEIYRYG